MIPKIAFLFLTIGTVYHETPWVNYFKGHESQYSLYVHPKEKLPQESFFYSSTLPHREETTWSNTMKAQIALLKEALKDPANTKFVFVSESTIPLTIFDEMYLRLTSDTQSQFHLLRNPFKNRPFGVMKEVYNNPQWVILNRKHAQWMVDDISLNQEDQERIEAIDQFIAKRLLTHLQAEIPELSHLNIWGQLKVRDITHELLDKLSTKAYRRAFQGTCDICQDWAKLD